MKYRSPIHRALVVVAGLAACGAPAEGPSDEVDALDAPPDAPTSCAGGETASATIGPDGGELSLCGARLAVSPGVLADPAELAITALEAPAELPFERTLAGGVFAFSASVDPLPGLISIDVPAAAGPGYLYLYRRVDADWIGIEACRVDGGVAGQDVAALGTFAALRDTNVYPPSANGLGEGTVDVSLAGEDRPFTLDASSRGIYQEDATGGRLVTLYLWYTPPDGKLEVLDLTFSVPARGAPGVIAAAWTDLGGPSYSYIAGLTPGAAAITLDPASAGERYVGQVEVTFEDPEGVEHLLTASLDVIVERYAYPPELSCPGGPEG